MTTTLKVMSKVYVVAIIDGDDLHIYNVATSVEVAKELVRGYVEVKLNSAPIEWTKEVDGLICDVGGVGFVIEERDLISELPN